MRNGSCWSDVVFEEEVIFHTFDFDTSSLEFEVSKSSIWKHPTSCDKGVFFFQLSRNSDDQSRSNYTGLLFYRYVEKHQVRRLVFDNYQKCPLSLKKKKKPSLQFNLTIFITIPVKPLLFSKINITIEAIDVWKLLWRPSLCVNPCSACIDKIIAIPILLWVTDTKLNWLT